MFIIFKAEEVNSETDKLIILLLLSTYIKQDILLTQIGKNNFFSV